MKNLNAKLQIQSHSFLIPFLTPYNLNKNEKVIL